VLWEATLLIREAVPKEHMEPHLQLGTYQ